MMILFSFILYAIFSITYHYYHLSPKLLQKVIPQNDLNHLRRLNCAFTLHNQIQQ